MDIVFKIGILIVVVGIIFFIVEVFRTSVAWGIACVFIYPLGIVFTIMHWKVARDPVLVKLAGLVVMMIGTP